MAQRQLTAKVVTCKLTNTVTKNTIDLSAIIIPYFPMAVKEDGHV